MAAAMPAPMQSRPATRPLTRHDARACAARGSGRGGRAHPTPRAAHACQRRATHPGAAARGATDRIEVVLRGGSRLDPPAREGVAALTAELLKYGAGERDAFAFADAVGGAGGNFDVEVHSEAIHVHGQFLARDRAAASGAARGCTCKDRICRGLSSISCVKRRIESIRATKDSGAAESARPLRPLAAVRRSSLRQSRRRRRDQTDGIDRADVTRLYREHFGADRLTFVFAGDFERSRCAIGRHGLGCWSPPRRHCRRYRCPSASAAVGCCWSIHRDRSSRIYGVRQRWGGARLSAAAALQVATPPSAENSARC